MNKGAYQGSFIEEDNYERALKNQSNFSKQRLGRCCLHRTQDQTDAKCRSASRARGRCMIQAFEDRWMVHSGGSEDEEVGRD